MYDPVFFKWVKGNLVMLTLGWHYVRAFSLIYLALFLGNQISRILPIEIPGSIIGMMILFSLLSLRIVSDDWVKPGCLLMIRYMALLFVPIAVGVMKYYDQLSQQMGPIVVSCIVSTLITMFIVGFSAHLVYKEKS